MLIAILTAAAALVALGAALSYVALVSLGIRREEAHRTFTLPTEDNIARGARTTMGVHAKRPALIHEAVAYRRDPRPSQDQER